VFESRYGESHARQALPPVGWLAYCRFAQAAPVAVELEQPKGGHRKDDHANAN
jgi:hypothetical protein